LTGRQDRQGGGGIDEASVQRFGTVLAELDAAIDWEVLAPVYCEGDAALKDAGSPECFVAELREFDAWNRAHGYGPARIDPGFDPAMKAVFEGLGLADMLH